MPGKTFNGGVVVVYEHKSRQMMMTRLVQSVGNFAGFSVRVLHEWYATKCSRQAGITPCRFACRGDPSCRPYICLHCMFSIPSYGPWAGPDSCKRVWYEMKGLRDSEALEQVHVSFLCCIL